ncbi:MAG: hypothetical protein ACFFDN_31285, partial [Candidatus Hodarchaeota archaeon]
MRKTKKVLTLGIMLISLFLFVIFQNKSLSKLNPVFNNEELPNDIRSSQSEYDSIEWIQYGNFSSGAENYWDNETIGDATDINMTIGGDVANYTILGKENTVSFNDPLNDGTWYEFANGDFLLPDKTEVKESGCYVYHYWDESETGGQTHNFPSVHWKKNVSVSDDMSEYNITSASLEVKFNASVSSNVDTPNDDDYDYFAIGDFAEFYVEISDVEGTTPYRVAYNRTKYLGQQRVGFPTILTIEDKPIESIGDESYLIEALTRAFERDGKNFNITLGINIYCEDNVGGNDHDRWNALIIKSYNLTFTYEKIIDPLTKASWKQEEDEKIPDGTKWLKVHNATLNFKYKLGSGTWPSTSPNSEFRIKINGNQLAETVNLNEEATSNFKEAKSGGIEVTSFIVLDRVVNVSIELYIGDEFTLDKKLFISIDNVSLIIEYELIPANIEFQLWLDNQDKTTDKSVTAYWRENVSIALEYNETGRDLIPSATVSINGSGISKLLDEGTFNYTIEINSTDLSFGNNYLTIEAYKKDYSTLTIPIKIIVVDRIANISEIYLDNIDKTSTKTITKNFGESLPINITYTDVLTSNPISGATIKFYKGETEIGSFDHWQNQYNYTLDTALLDLGVNFVSVRAQKDNYTATSEILTIVIDATDTNYQLYINNIEKTSNPSIKIAKNEILTFKFIYIDVDSNSFIKNAIIAINGSGVSKVLEEFAQDYRISINSVSLSLGINYLTITAENVNYMSKSVIITVEIVERETELSIFLNGVNKTIDKSIELPIRSPINITAKYYDIYTGNYISGAEVRLIGENISKPFIENTTLRQYSILVNSSDLDIGVRFLTILAEKSNYESLSARLRIQVNRIRTNITIVSGETTINTVPGDNVVIQISLNDLDYGVKIINATVTYSTDFGQGELLDPDQDGTFQLELANVPEGTYEITISVYAGDDYDFERFRITLNAIRPPENVLLFQILTIVGIGAAITVGGYFIAYQRVLKY